ncbi:MAG: hypothetical protein KAW09_02615, partial [Thermoplasmata archaeon]|nr:hypothetical protein [Thermoplasmata archaeon]
GETISYDAQSTDPGSDDLTFTWSWGDGAPNNVTKYYNDGVWEDPHPSPDGTYPFSAIDGVTHIYQSVGTYAVALKVVDDDGGETVRVTSVTVTAPDLIPWDVRINGNPYTTPVQVLLGSDVDISARVRNLGTSDVTDTFYLDLEGTTTLQSTEIQGLGKGSISIEILSYKWNATAFGVHHYNITVDPSNDVVEMDESNNRLHVEVVVKGPDLIPEEIRIDGVEYVSPIETGPEEELNISFQVANIGEHSTGQPFMIALYNESESTHPFYTREISELDIDERSGRITVEWSAPSEVCECRIVIKVDYEDAVLELNEGNNIAKIQITGRGPDLIPEGVEVDGKAYVSPVEVEAGGSLMISVLAANIGEHSTGKAFKMAFYSSGVNAQAYCVEEIPELDIEERSGRITLDWIAPPIGGQYLIMIEVDYEDD